MEAASAWLAAPTQRKIIEVGRTIGHFELSEQLGIGHFGNVWKAKDTKLDRTVAIKKQLSDTEVETFLREARAAAQLRHPNSLNNG